MPNKEGGLFWIGFIAFCQSRSWSAQTKRGIFRYPASVLAPGAALGSVPTVALSSVQVGFQNNPTKESDSQKSLLSVSCEKE